VVALVASAALIPGTAFAAGSASAAPKAMPAVAGTAAQNSKPALKTFSSPASKSVRFRDTATEGAHVGAKATSSSPTIDIYVAPYFDATCSNAAGAGTEADPYCSIQDAVNAAVSGDTVGIISGQGYFSTEPVTVSTSGISLVGVGTGAMNISQTDGAPVLTLDGVSNVTISNLSLYGPGQNVPAVKILGSSDVTLDSDAVEGGYAGVNAFGTAIEIDGSSSHVTVSRTYLNTRQSAPADPGILVESGAADVTLAGDVLASAGISADKVSGLTVVGNTIQRGCDAAVDVEDASTGVYLENNLIEDANPTTDFGLGGYQSQCQANNQSWAPDVTVSADSVAGTTTDYNDFYVYGTDGTAEYDWAGTPYATLSDFRAAASQGTHDTLDPVQEADRSLDGVDSNLVTGSAAINSANLGAPGQLPTDFYGDSPYTSRGAVQYNTHDQSLGLAFSVSDYSARQVQLKATLTSDAGFTPSATISWGDGQSTLEPNWLSSITDYHAYGSLGTYTVTITVTDGAGDAVTNSENVTLEGTTYTQFGPTRLLDTRKGTGTGGVIAPIPANGGTIKLKIGGNAGIAADAWAVAANVTATDEKAQGYITAYPDGTTPTALSTVDFKAGENVANTSVVSVGDDGYIVLANHSAGTVDVIVDVSGYFTPTATGGYYTAMAPVRFLDTRSGTGGYAYKTVSQGHPVTLKIDGKSGIPSSGVSAVAVNITEASATGNGLITAWPGGTAQPGTSNLNFYTGEVRAASTIVPVGADGTIDLAYTGTGSARLIVDVEGYFNAGTSGSSYVPVDPFRGFDSRAIKNGALPGGYYYPIQTDVYGPIGGSEITGMVSNTTVTSVTAANGDLVIFPDNVTDSSQPVTIPNTSALNFVRGQTVANLSFVTPGAVGADGYYNQSAGSLQLIIDVMGFFMSY